MHKSASENELVKGGILMRSFTGSIKRADSPDGGEDAPALYSIAISSEAEVERWFGIEILEHSAQAIDLSRMLNGAAVLVDHGGDQVGVVEAVRLEDGVLRGDIRFSRSQRGKEIEQDVVDGIRRNVSVGYFVNKAERIDSRNGVDVWRVTRWQPAEVSIVSVPADITVGVGRSVDADSAGISAEIIIGDDAKIGESKMADVQVTPVSDNRESRNREILSIVAANNLPASVAEEFTRNDGAWSSRSVADVAVEIANRRKTSGNVPPSAEALGMNQIPDKDLARYSYHRAIKRTVETLENPHNARFDGVEAEVHQHIERNWPIDLPKRGGFFVPMRTSNMAQRTLSSTQGTKGPELVNEAAGDLIELLRARAIVLQLGARLLTGLTGPVGFPRVTGGVTVNWVPENPANDTPAADPALGLALLTPKTMQGVVPFTRQLAMQGSIDIESWVRDELAIGHSLVLDKAAIHGKGTGGEPLGIYNAANVVSKDFSNTLPTVSTLMDMVVGVHDNNADIASMNWLTSVVMAGKLRTILEFSAAGSSTLWQGSLRNGSMLGYGASSSTQASKVMSGSVETGGTSQAMIFGNWSDLIVAMFGAMEFVVDPFTKKNKNIIEVATFQMGDILPRHGESFAKAVNCPSS